MDPGKTPAKKCKLENPEEYIYASQEVYEEEFNDSPTKHPNDDSEAEPCIPRPPLDSSSPTLVNPQHYYTPE